jgi:hypothetical protein
MTEHIGIVYLLAPVIGVVLFDPHTGVLASHAVRIAANATPLTKSTTNITEADSKTVLLTPTALLGGAKGKVQTLAPLRNETSISREW